MPQKSYKRSAQINCNFESQRASFANLTIENAEPGEAVKFAKTRQRHILPEVKISQPSKINLPAQSEKTAHLDFTLE